MSELEDEHSSKQNEQAAEETKEKPKKKRRFRWLSVFLGVLLIIAVSLQLAIKYYSDVIIKRILQEAVTLKSEGMYSLDFEEGSFSFFEQEFNIKNLTFELNEARWRELKANGVNYKLLYDFEIPEIEMSAGSLKEAWLSRSWTIDHFYIRQPNVRVRATDQTAQAQNTKQETNLFFLISGYLNEFKVSQFGLEQAAITYTDASAQSYTLKEINVNISGFKVDSTSILKDGKPFYVEDLECSIGKNAIALPNGIAVDFTSLYGSISGEKFAAKNLKLLSYQNNSSFSGKSVAFRELEILGLQYSQLYFDSVFQATSIQLHKPFVDLGKVPSGSGSSGLQGLAYEKVSKFIKSFIVGNIALDSAAIYAKMPGNNLAIDDFTLALENVWFDESSWQKRKQRFFTDDFELRLRNYIADLPDGLHQLKALELGFSTKRNYAYCNNVLIAPNSEDIPTKQLYEANKDKLINFYLSRIELTGLDIWRAYIDRRLRMATFRVNRPRLEMNHFVNLNNEMRSIYRADSIQQVLDKMEIDSLFDDVLEIYDFDSLAVDSLPLRDSLPKPVGGEMMTMDIAEMTNQLNLNKVNAVAVVAPVNDTIPKNTSFTTYLLNYFDSAYTARDDSLLYVAMVDSVNNLDMDSLLLADIIMGINTAFKSVDINTVDINEARFNYYECTNDTLERISVQNTDVTLREFSVSQNTYADTNRLLFSREMEINVESLGYFLSDSLHYLSTENLRISSADSLIRAGRTWLRPYERNRSFIVKNIQESNGIFDVRLASFLANEINFREVFREQRVMIELLSIEKPNILHFISANPNAPPKDSTAKKENVVALDTNNYVALQELAVRQLTLSDYIKSFGVRAVNFNQGFYSLAQVSNRTRELLSARDIQLCVRDLIFDSVALSNNEILPLAKDAEILANNYFINLPDSVHTLQSKSLGISLSSSAVYFYNTRIRPSAIGRRMRDVNKYDVSIPEFRLDGVDWPRLYFDQELYVRELLVNDPDISMETIYDQKPAGAKQEEKQETLERDQKNLFTADMRDAVLKVFNGLEIDRMNLNRGVLHWQQLENRTLRQHLRTDRLDLAVNTFRIDSTVNEVPARFMFAFDWRVNARNVIHELPDQWHSVRTSKIEFSSAANTFYATYLHYAPKNWADIDFIKGNKPRKDLTEVYTPLLSIRGTNLQKLLTENALFINDIQLDNPKFRLVLHPKEQEKPPRERFSTVKLDSLLRQNFREVQIKRFQFEDASLQLGLHPKNGRSFYLDVDEVFTKVDNFNNLFQSYDSSRFMLADDIHVGVKNYELDLPDSIYKLEAEEMGFRTKDDRIYIQDLNVKPRIPKKAIAEIHGNEIDWIHLKVDSIILANFQFSVLLESDKLVADRLDIEHMDTYVYRDKRPPSTFGRRPPMPQQFLRNMKTYIKLDTINLYNSKVTYEELAVDGKQPGQIYFDDLNAYGFNITNDSALLADGAAVQLFANAYLMGEGRIDAAFTFPLDNENNSFTYQGSLAPMDLRSINPMLEHVASLKVNSGISRKLNFEVQADEEYADGFMRFYYRDLNVALLKKDAKPKKQGKIKGLLTMFANVLVKSKNPRFLFLKRGKIYTERDKSKSIFNYWAKTLLSGIKHSVGFSYEKPPKERRKTVFQFWKRRRKDFRRKNLELNP